MNIDRLTTIGLGVLFAAGVTSAQSFTDVTNAAGLGGSHNAYPVTAKPAIMVDSAAVGDYDGDGWDDIFWHGGSGQATRLYRNNQDGTFTNVAVEAGVAIKIPGSQALWFDYDNDGDLDLHLAVMQQYYPTPMLEGGGGQASYMPAGLWLNPPSPSVVTKDNFLWRNNGDGTFTDVTAEAGAADTGGWGLAAGDLNGDGLLDLLGSTWDLSTPLPLKVHLNAGNGTFREATPDNFVNNSAYWTHGFSPHIVDMDFDGDRDIIVGGDFDTSSFYLNDGNFNFTEVTAAAGFGTDQNGMGSAICDFDNDNDLDMFVSAIYWAGGPFPAPFENWGHTGNRLYVNNGDGTFSDGTDAAGVRDGGWGWGANFADINNDGHPDLIHTNGWYSPEAFPFYDDDAVRVFMNDGNGVFSDEAANVGLVDTDQGRGLVVCDFNKDGALDVLISNNDTGLTLWQNDPLTVSGSYLEVEVRGTVHNSQGIGARVTVTASDGSRQTRHIECGSNFMSQTPARAWFGLGDAAGAATLKIVWPDGTIETVTDVAVNQRATIVEGIGVQNATATRTQGARRTTAAQPQR